MNRQYADQYEENDFELLTQFNTKLNIKQLGQNQGQMKKQ